MPEQDIFAEDSEVEVISDIPQNVEIQEYAGEVEVGEVTTLPAGSDATVTNTGTATHAVLNFGIPKGDSGSEWGEITGTLSDQTDLQNAFNAVNTAISAKAAANNAILTGLPVAPTAADSTNTTQIATTAFVQNAITLLRNEINQAVANVLKRMDFSNAVSIIFNGNNVSYTAPSDGYIIYTESGTNNSQYPLLINGKIIFGYSRGSTNTTKFVAPASGAYIPVSANDVISFSSGIGSSYYTYLTFVPQKP